MNNYNIILAGVGGQGLVLTTKIICYAGMLAGYDVKSNDVVGLSQRGGKVWGSVKLGEKIHSPNIASNSGDIIVGMELLEAYRWRGILKNQGTIITNTEKIPPVAVITEKVEYPLSMIEELEENYNVYPIDATITARNLGSVKVMNTVLVGKLASLLDISDEIWMKALKDNVPSKFLDMNIEAFGIGYKA